MLDFLRRTPIGRVITRIARGLYEHDLDIPMEGNVIGFWKAQGSRYMDEQDGLPDWKKQAFRSQEAALVEFLRGLHFENVLEVGCGYGRILRPISEGFDVALTGVDISSEQLRNAAIYLNDPNVRLYGGSADDLPFPNESFDFVLACNVLLHVPPRKLDAVLKEILRVSRHHVVFVEPVKGDNGYFRKPYCWDYDYEGRLRRFGLAKIEHGRNSTAKYSPERRI